LELKPPRALVWLTAAGLIAATFVPAYGLLRFHDDWTFVYKAAAAVRTHTVAQFVFEPLEQHWSPLWHSLEVVNFLVAGWESDWLIRSFIAVSTFGALLLCAALLDALGVSLAGQLVAIGVLALHHAAAAARFSFDTYSQSLVDLANWTAVALVLPSLLLDRQLATSTIAFVLALLVPALFLKEQALSAFFAIGLTTAAASAWRHDLRRSIRAWQLLVVLVAIAAAFTVTRVVAGVRFPEEGSPFSLCVRCAPVNIAELGGVLLLPIRTLVVLDAVRSSPVEWTRIVVAAVAAAALGLAIACGNVLRAKRGGAQARALALVACACIASFFPVALLFHVGELYAHTALFWFAVLVGFAVDGWWTGSRGARAAVLVCAATYLVSIGAGQRVNLDEMRATGERARQWLGRIVDRLQPVRDRGFVLIAATGEYKGRFDYGLYRVTTPQVLVLTGLSPYPVRAALHDRLTVFLEIADRERWRRPLEDALARGDAFRLVITGDDARLSPWMSDAASVR
jgi:hypothetical protein